jgi:hypothetical protein
MYKNKYKMKTVYFYLIGFVFLFFSCEEKILEPVNVSKGKPGVVSEISAASVPGGAKISYRIPDSPDLLSVKAVYTITNGQKREAIASYYLNSLTLEGYADTLRHEAQLYAISRAQEISDPVTVTFTPSESSLSKTIKTVSIESDFGGAAYSWVNEDSASLTFDFLTTDANGEMSTVAIFQSVGDTMEHIIRGYTPQPRKFGLIISDNWGNSSGIISPEEGLLIPLREDRLDKTIMKIMHLNADAWLIGWGFKDEFLIDDDLSTPGHTIDGDLPAYFTIDLGKPTYLSRMVMNQRLFENQYFIQANLKSLDVFHPVSTDDPDPNFWEWTKIMTCDVIKPSGLPGTEVSIADMRVGKTGHEFNFPKGLEPVRYLRFLMPRSTWGDRTYGQIAELTFFGLYDE